MKRIIISTLLVSVSLAIKAQHNIPYAKLDSISAIISEYQSKSENLFYNDGKDTYKLSFPKDNFKIYFSTQKATSAIYKTKDGDEYLYLSEDIDLTKADDIYNTLYPGSAGAFRVFFPQGFTTQIYKNGEYVETTADYYLEFFFPREIINKTDEAGYKPGTKEFRDIKAAIAYLKLENKLSANLFIHGSWVNYKKYGDKVIENYNQYVENTFGNYNKLETKASEIWLSKGWRNPGYLQSQIEASKYFDLAYKIDVPKIINLDQSVVWHLLATLSQAKNFSRMEEILESPNAYFLDLQYENFLNYKAEYMIGTGKCLEGEKILLENYKSSESSKALRYSMSRGLTFLYKDGCKGEGDNKVKKDRKLAKQYSW